MSAGWWVTHVEFLIVVLRRVDEPFLFLLDGPIVVDDLGRIRVRRE